MGGRRHQQCVPNSAEYRNVPFEFASHGSVLLVVGAAMDRNRRC